jgi:heme/copper-type cytochrome/quinol oxidase subunit 1
VRATDRLSMPQRVVVVITLGLVLAFAGSYLMSLGSGANGWYAYSPLTSSTYAPGLPAWLRLIIWLALTGFWAVASIRILRPAPGRPAR